MQRVGFTIKIILLLVAVTLAAGCSSPVMQPADFRLKPDRTSAVVNFMRPSILGVNFKFGIWDRENFVGLLTARNYVQYRAKPGSHFFMASAENWSGIKATVKAGKNYYILVAPGEGAWKVWKARVEMSVLKPNDPELAEWMQKLKPITPVRETQGGYIAEQIDNVRQARKNFESGAVPYTVMKASDGR